MYHSGFSDYYSHLYCYIHNDSADVSSSLLLVSEFLRRSLMIFIIQGFQTIVFIFIVIFTTFRPICLLQVILVEHWSLYGTSNHILYLIHGRHYSYSVYLNRVKVLSIPVLLPPDFDEKQLKKAGGLIGRNVLNITIKMKTITRKP